MLIKQKVQRTSVAQHNLLLRCAFLLLTCSLTLSQSQQQENRLLPIKAEEESILDERLLRQMPGTMNLMKCCNGKIVCKIM